MNPGLNSFYLFVCCLLFFFSCNMENKQAGTEKPYIVATTGMIGDALKNLLRDSAEIEALMGPGVDPHLYKATQGDLTKMTRADLIVYNGLHLEGKMGEVLENLGRRKFILAMAETIPDSLLIVNNSFQGAHDPHIWFDVTLWRKAIAQTSEEIKQKYPSLTPYLQLNHQTYDDQLKELDQWVRGKLAELDTSQRILITAHDAFGYFGRAYGVTVKGLQGISTQSEFGLKDRQELVQYIIRNKINAVFIETSVSPRSIEAIVSDCQSLGHEVKIGGNLYSDAMGKEGTSEGTYIGMVRANVTTIVESLKSEHD